MKKIVINRTYSRTKKKIVTPIDIARIYTDRHYIIAPWKKFFLLVCIRVWRYAYSSITCSLFMYTCIWRFLIFYFSARRRNYGKRNGERNRCSRMQYRVNGGHTSGRYSAEPGDQVHRSVLAVLRAVSWLICYICPFCCVYERKLLLFFFLIRRQ